MTRRLMQLLLVVAVVGAFAVGRGLRASAEVPAAKPQKPASPRFVCAQTDNYDNVFPYLRVNCDPTRNFTVTYLPTTAGTILVCCVSN